jgi:acyl-CoA thioester hydrolase
VGSEPEFVHIIRPRYAEVDMQGVVFNAHWLTYFDETCTRFFEAIGYEPGVAFFTDFDLMLVKAVLEWQGPARFDQPVDVAVAPSRLGTTSLDLRYVATTGGEAACAATITYVSVQPGTHTPEPIPAGLRTRLESRLQPGFGVATGE